MIDFGIEKIMDNARAMGDDEIRVFLTQINEDLLTGEINRRLKRAKDLEEQGKALFLGGTINNV